jgi:hypothetical protein
VITDGERARFVGDERGVAVAVRHVCNPFHDARRRQPCFDVRVPAFLHGGAVQGQFLDMMMKMENQNEHQTRAFFK